METEHKAPVRCKHSKILVAYLSGQTIEYFDESEQDWLCVYRYTSPSDVLRLTNKNYKFRIKSEK